MRRTYRFKKIAVEIRPGDRVHLQLLLYNSYDLTWPLIVILGAFRIVCTNGLVVGKEFFQFRKRHVVEIDRICQKAERHIRDILTMAYYTGMRRGEILNLTWDKVDMKGRFINLDAEDTKDREKRTIPICNELYKTLKNIPRNIRARHVFTYKRKPMKNIKKGLRTACEDAEVLYGRGVKGGGCPS